MDKAERRADLIRWWRSVVEDPRYPRMEMELLGSRSFPGGVEANPHAQHVADGYRQGFEHSLLSMKRLAWEEETQSTEEMDFGEPTVHPDLARDNQPKE